MQNDSILKDSILQDTILNDTIIKDTIAPAIEKTSKAVVENINIYQEILNSQTQTYNLILFMFLGIIALFAGATWLYNRNIAKSVIIEETNKIFQKEKEKMKEEFRNEIERELNYIKGESARLFGLTITGDKPHNIINRFYWWTQALKYYKLVNKGKGVNASANAALTNLKEALEKKADCKAVLLELYPNTDYCFYNVFETIPDELHEEKKELIKLTKELLD